MQQISSIINKNTIYTCVCPGDRRKVNLAAAARPPYLCDF